MEYHLFGFNSLFFFLWIGASYGNKTEQTTERWAAAQRLQSTEESVPETFTSRLVRATAHFCSAISNTVITGYEFHFV